MSHDESRVLCSNPHKPLKALTSSLISAVSTLLSVLHLFTPRESIIMQSSAGSLWFQLAILRL